MRHLRFLWSIPWLITLISCGVIAWAQLERHRVVGLVEGIVRGHVESVAKLTAEGARQASAAIDMTYTLAEDNLAIVAHCVSHQVFEGRAATQEAPAQGLAVWMWLPDGSPLRPEGFFGPLPPEDLGPLAQEILAFPEAQAIDSGLARRYGLYCAHFPHGRGRVIACDELDELSRLRKQIGLGPLLSQVARASIVYVAVQDPTGLLASSPGLGSISVWRTDLALEQALKRPSYREVHHRGRIVWEGLSAFALPDGSEAVLRVGVDTSSAKDLIHQVGWRHQMLIAALILLSVGAFVTAGLLARREKKQIAAEARLAAQEQEQHHWQGVGQMAATVAHEVRNPVNTIQMAAQRLGAEFQIQDGERVEFDELIAVLGSEAHRVNRVVSEFLELSKPLKLQPQVRPIGEALAEAVRPLQLAAAAADKRIALETGCQSEIPLDPIRFSQIIGNLVHNALDAMPPGGTCRITAQDSPDGDGVAIAILDDGAGMDEKTLRDVQKPFVTTKAKGTGLGLSLARRLTEAHGGKLSISSERGKGTRVDLHFSKRGPTEHG